MFSSVGLKVGQSVFVEYLGNEKRYRTDDGFDATVTKVGRVYFEVSGTYSDCRFFLADGRQKTNYSRDFRVYTDKESFLADLKYRKDLEKLRSLFGAFSNPPLSHDQVNRILAIISEGDA